MFLFCILEIFEMLLIINNMNKTEKLEVQLLQNVEVLKIITASLNEHLECMELEHHKDKRVKIK